MAEDFTNTMLTKMLDLSAKRHRVLANNLANVNTPGFRRQDVSFNEEFSDAVKKGPDAIQNLHAQILEDETATARADGNTVQLEWELAEMSKNAMSYQMAIQMLNMRISMQRMAITGRV